MLRYVGDAGTTMVAVTRTLGRMIACAQTVLADGTHVSTEERVRGLPWFIFGPGLTFVFGMPAIASTFYGVIASVVAAAPLLHLRRRGVVEIGVDGIVLEGRFVASVGARTSSGPTSTTKLERCAGVSQSKGGAQRARSRSKTVVASDRTRGGSRA